MRVEVFGAWFSIFEFFVIPFFIFLVPALLFTRARIKDKRSLNIYLLAVFLFFVSILLSSYGAMDKKAVIKGFLKWIEIFGLSALVFLYCSSIRRFKQIWWLLVLVFACGIVAVTIRAPLVHYGIKYSSLRQQFSGYSSLFLLSLVLPFSTHHRSITLVSGLLGVLIILSLTRGAWLGLLAIGIYWGWKSRHASRTLSVAVLGALILGLALFAVPDIRNAVHSKLQESSNLEWGSNRERLGMAVASLKFFYEHPFTGVGAENFPDYLLKGGKPSFVTAREPEKLSPHNFFLQVAAENGIIGLFAIFSWLWVMYRILFYYHAGNQISHYFAGLQLYFIVLVIALLFGYVSGESRVELGLYLGLVLTSLRVFPEYHIIDNVGG